VSMTRSDLPRVAALPVEQQRQAVQGMWAVFNKVEQHSQGPEECPISWVATFAEMLEAALVVVSP
jgi:hypothetical protein